MSDAFDIELRLNWRHTWPDRPDDYVCKAPEHRGSVGRIVKIDGGPQSGRWQWAYQAMLDGVRREGELNGVADTPRQAAAKIEDRWFRDSEVARKRA